MHYEVPEKKDCLDKIGFLRENTPQFLIWDSEVNAFGFWPKLLDTIVKPNGLVATFIFWRKKRRIGDFASVFKL